MRKLTVTQAFGDYQVGQTITNAETIKAVETSHPGYVVASIAPDEPKESAGSPEDAPAEAKPTRTR